jgi:hypothetical protein
MTQGRQMPLLWCCLLLPHQVLPDRPPARVAPEAPGVHRQLLQLRQLGPCYRLAGTCDVGHPQRGAWAG